MGRFYYLGIALIPEFYYLLCSGRFPPFYRFLSTRLADTGSIPSSRIQMESCPTW